MGKHLNAAPDEQTPLLANSAIAPNADPDVAPSLINDSSSHDEHLSDTTPSSDLDDPEDDDFQPADKPLPKTQIFLLCFARLVEPVAFFSIFPFINQMVQRNGRLPETDVGFYSGLNESLFSLTQMVVMIFWGRAADRVGRKPVLVVSLYGIAVSVSLFGFARKLWQMILFRCLSGVFAGSIVTIRTMVSELSTQRTQARAFSFFAFAGNLGIFLGPLIGGALADPGEQYPRFFGGVGFFKEYPYALSTVCTGAIGFIAATITALFVKETRDPVPKSMTSSASSSSSQTITANGSSPHSNEPKEPTTTLQLLRYPGVLPTLYLYAHIMLLPFAYTAIAPLFNFTSIARGGFGFTPSQISLLLSWCGFAQAVWLLLIFPPLHDRFGTVGVTKMCAVFYPFFFAVNPGLNALLRRSIRGQPPAAGSPSDGSDTTITTTTTTMLSLLSTTTPSSLPKKHHHPIEDGTPYRILFWILTPSFLALGSGVSMCFTTMQLAINDVSPSPATLGTLNALALTLLSGLRSFSPWLFTTLFAVGARTQFLAGYAVWWLLTLLAVGMAGAVFGILPGIYEGIEERRMRGAGRYVGINGDGNGNGKVGKTVNKGGVGAYGKQNGKGAKKVRANLRRGRSEHV